MSVFEQKSVPKRMSIVFLFTALCTSLVSSAACYVTYQRSCAELHADQKRVCSTQGTPPIKTPCGDVIVADQDVDDVKSALNGQAGTDAINVPSGTIEVNVTVFRCSSGGNCQNTGIKKFTCQGRTASGNACTGTVSSSN